MIVGIKIRTIPHKNQRYPTIGDWIWQNLKERLDRSELDIRVSDLGDWRYEFLVAFHEQIETILCSLRGIKQQDVDLFDKRFEESRQENDFTEPGDCEDAPYHREHKFATKLEFLMAQELGVDWDEYNAKINSM